MDFDRIKQRLRLRSGRGQKFQEHPLITQSREEEKKRNPPQPPEAKEYAFKERSSSPTLRVWDRSTALPPIDSDYNLRLQNELSRGAQPTPRKLRFQGQGSKAEDQIENSPNTKKIRKLSAPTRSQTQGNAMSRREAPPNLTRNHTDSNVQSQSTDEIEDFDLRPPPRKSKPTAMDGVSESLYSSGHLEILLHDPDLFVRFSAFINRYRSHYAPILIRYLETQKAIKAIEYANAVAESVVPLPTDKSNPQETAAAARIDSAFQERCQKAFDTLLLEALPGYVTYNIVKVVTEIMINEITGRYTPITNGLVDGLTEVFCLTDPSQEDNPIVYASEEFYRMTGYDRDFVIGSNCRFLQGPKTKSHSVRRLSQAIESGQEISEIILNYRRDGRPFMNVLMVAPLHDNKGSVKYYIGAQVDVSGLIEGGKGLDSFERYLTKQQALERKRSRSMAKQHNYGASATSKDAKKKALSKLGELSDMFDLEESVVVSQRSRSNSMSDGENSAGNSSKARRVIPDSEETENDQDDETHEKEKAAWNLSVTGFSGRLPGVYQSYFLVRPAPSLKIVFTSQPLRRMGNLVQSHFLSHVSAPAATLAGLKDSFESDTPVTAKVLFSPEVLHGKDGRKLKEGQNFEDIDEESSVKAGRTCWLSATPLLGSDNGVGVWMVVIVEKRILSSAMLTTSSNRLKRSQTPSRKQKEVGAEDEQKQPESRNERPPHINLPDPSTTSQANKGSESLPNGDIWQSVTERTKSGQEIIIRRNEPLDKSQSPMPDTREEAADEFVQKSEPRGPTPRPVRVNIKPDSEEEDKYRRPIDQGERQYEQEVAKSAGDGDENLANAGSQFGSHQKMKRHAIGPLSPPPMKQDSAAPSNRPDRPELQSVAKHVQASSREDNTDNIGTASVDQDTIEIHAEGKVENCKANDISRQSSVRQQSYIDYLRHPGSRPGSSMCRGGSFLTGNGTEKAEENFFGKEEQHEDLECEDTF